MILSMTPISIKSAIDFMFLCSKTIQIINKIMSEKNITFEDMPKAMSWMMDKLNELDSKIDGLNNSPQTAPSEIWMNLKELREYLPSHPAEQTVYGWTSCHQIPFHKKGKRIMFLKSEIDDWLHDGKMKSQKELEHEAEKFIKSKRKRHF